jgi:hypothetical protein
MRGLFSADKRHSAVEDRDFIKFLYLKEISIPAKEVFNTYKWHTWKIHIVL